jgi:hypothetical protein
MPLEEMADRQRNTSQAAAARRSQRNQSPVQAGVVERLGSNPAISIQGGAAVNATNLGGVLRVGQVVIVESDGLNYWTRGAQAL